MAGILTQRELYTLLRLIDDERDKYRYLTESEVDEVSVKGFLRLEKKLEKMLSMYTKSRRKGSK